MNHLRVFKIPLLLDISVGFPRLFGNSQEQSNLCCALRQGRRIPTFKVLLVVPNKHG
jgi:hypothetical protein